MTAWTPWEIVRHQVAAWGRVLDTDGRPIAGVQVTLAALPEVSSRRDKGAAAAAEVDRENLNERPDHTLSRADGIFYFLDLPPGHYLLRGVDNHSGAHAEKRVSVTWSREGKVNRVVADLELSAD